MTVDPGFTTPEMARIFSSESRVDLMCRFEAELAAAQAEIGIVPVEAAEAIRRACVEPPGDAEGILRRGWDEGTPVKVLLDELRTRLSDDDAGWIHHGATTQDAVDTALMLQIRSALELIGASVDHVAQALAGLADSHRDTPLMGRTFLQDALPTSFGARAALWLQPLIGTARDVDEMGNQLPVQLGGPVGDMASFGAAGFEVAQRLAERLGLVAPPAPWHTDRTAVIKAAGLVDRAASAAAKIAADITFLSASGEIRVRAGGSSSMPHKQNPVDALRAGAAARVCRTAVAGLIAGPPHELERAAGAWHAEWELVPLAFEAGAAALDATERAVDTLEVDAERMAERAGTAEVPDVGLIDRVLEAYRSQRPDSK